MLYNVVLSLLLLIIQLIYYGVIIVILSSRRSQPSLAPASPWRSWVPAAPPVVVACMAMAQGTQWMGWISLDLRSDWFRKCVVFFGGFNMLPHEMMIRNDDLVCPGMFYRQRTKSQTAKACESLCPEKEEACHTLRCQPKIKASYTAPQKPIAVENVSRNCGGI